MKTTIRSSVLAGIAIGIAGFGYLASGKDIAGAILFAFGLATVVHYSLKLYTGTAGFIQKGELGTLFIILLFNLVGCALMGLMARCSPLPLQSAAQSILEGRLSIGPLRGCALSIGCGFIMTTAVQFARQNKMLPLIFGVPLFIVCGFPHCVADAFYYFCVPLSFLSAHWLQVLLFYISIVIGNFIGCNLYRMVMNEHTGMQKQ